MAAFFLLLWFYPNLVEGRARKELLDFRSKVDIGTTKSQFKSIFQKGNYYYLEYVAVNSRVTIDTPLKLGARNWVLHCDFLENKLTGMQIRTLDSPLHLPEGAPEDIISNEKRPLKQRKLGIIHLGQFKVRPIKIPNKEFTLKFDLGFLDENNGKNKELLIMRKDEVCQRMINYMKNLSENFLKEDDGGLGIRNELLEISNSVFPEFDNKEGLVLKVFTPTFLIKESP
jgi:hypothetical protein